MTDTHVIRCGGAGPAAADKSLSLALAGREKNIDLKLSDVSETMVRNVPDILVDLMEIATYVFAADQGIGRGGPRDTGERWRRTLDFHIPVRRLDIWSRQDVADALVDLLSFLSDDEYSFTFHGLTTKPPIQLYFEFGDSLPDPEVDRVALFSGGIDSLGGAVASTLVEKKNVALVSHRSAPKRVKNVEWLAAQLAARSSPRSVWHIPVWATKSQNVGHEYSQRTRSFLYASLAAAVASLLKLDGICFYENGVTSINLPIAAQVLGGRATRTTHPVSIEDFTRLFSLIFDRPFRVETPFLWMTKTDVFRFLVTETCGDLIPKSVSCSRIFEATKIHTHCGRCIQCLDRRFSALAAGLTDAEDPEEMYRVDLFRGARPFGEDRTMAETFVERARKFRELDDTGFFQTFPEATRALSHVNLECDEAAKRLLDLHRRHGKDVGDVLAGGLRDHAEEFQSGNLPDSCLLVLTLPDSYRRDAQSEDVSPEGNGSDARKSDASKRSTFRREGDVWRVQFENESATIKDTLGMRYIAQLLNAPGRRFRCVDLVAADAGQTNPPLTPTSGDVTDWGSLSDCRERLTEIKTEIADAERAGDSERRLQLLEDAKSIQKYLNAGTGLRSRPRRETDEAERARKAVANSISRAMKRIDKSKQDPLWRHLHRYLHLGNSCFYEPPTPIDWIVET